MFDPVDKDSAQKECIAFSKRKWLTSQGFVFPGFKSSFESNMPSCMPDDARLEELREVSMSFKFQHFFCHVLIYACLRINVSISPLQVPTPVHSNSKASREIRDSDIILITQIQWKYCVPAFKVTM